MRVKLKGIASATKKLADGRKVKYYYAWRGGPKLQGQPGSPEFIASYNAAIAARIAAPVGTVESLIREFKTATEFTTKAPSTKRAYDTYLKLISTEFGDMPIAALSDPACRGDFKEWRDRFAHNPRKADYAWTTLARVFSVAKDRGRISVNPCEKGGRLYEAARAERVWSDGHLMRFKAQASPEVWAVVLAALWTGQRQGDLLRLTWFAYDGAALRLAQNKTKRKVVIPCGTPLKALLDALDRKHERVFLTTRKTPWTGDGFRSSFAIAMREAGLSGEDLHFHDLRGTAVTRLATAGATEAEIATFTGHSLITVRAILDKHYLARDVAMAESAIRKLESAKKDA